MKFTRCPVCWERDCKCPPVALAEPTERGRARSRGHFEKLMIEIMGCKVGDGTLEIKADRRYKNEYIEYMWTRYRNKPKEST